MIRQSIQTFFASFEPLRERNFAIYLSGQAVSLIGTWLQATAQGWVVWELSGSAAALGVVASFATLPLLILAPFTGTIADRFDRRRLLIGTQISAMLLAFILAVLVQTKLVQLWHVYILALALGVVGALDFPTQQAFLGDLSGMHLVRKAVNLNSMVLQVSRILGPAFAGFIIATYGTATSFWLNGVSFIPVIGTLLIVRAHQARRSSGENPLRAFAGALRFVQHQPRLQDILFLVALVTFFGLSNLSLMPAFASTVLGGDAQTLGWLLAASGAGALISVIFVIPFVQAARRTGVVIAVCAIWMGFWIMALAEMRALPLAIATIFLLSLGAPAVIATSLGLAQHMAPPDMRARVVSLFIMVSFGMQPIAGLYVGYTAQYLGVPFAILLNGILMVAGSALILLLRSPLRAWSALPQAAPSE
ncbi:MAG TPA: MFS transporter [Anaerolineae bacterium]|nr:MFS transporter [Anaerolineae bacterium]